MISLKVRILTGLAIGVALLVIGWVGRRTGRNLGEPVLTGMALGAGGGLLLFLFVAWRQLTFPLQLEAMELTILQHVERLVAGLPVYPRPSADFVALAYNPGLYVLLWPVGHLVPPSLFLLRLPDFAASLLLIGLFGFVLRTATGSWRWAACAAFIPVLATRSFDCNLVTGHADILVIACSLVGALALEGKRVPVAGVDRRILASLLFVSAFWFKQNAALMGVGLGLYFLMDDRRTAWRPLIPLVLLGPVAYWLAGPRCFGPDFLEATMRVPASWSRLDRGTVARYAGFVLTWWAVPLIVAVRAWLAARAERRLTREPLLFLLPFALLSGFTGALDSGSSDNVFSMAGAWLIVVMLQAVGPWLQPAASADRRRVAVGALVFTGAFLLHDFRDWNPPFGARAAYSDLRKMLAALDGPVYAPWLGNLPAPGSTTARAHWVALEDRVRGQGIPAAADPYVMEILAPVAAARSPAYLLTSTPLEQDYLLSWLARDYTLDHDFGARWDALRELPHRFGARYPRYLYRRTAS